jgi:hypothetical protein
VYFFEDDAAVGDTKSQDRNECFELDTCWCGFRKAKAESGPRCEVECEGEVKDNREWGEGKKIQRA